MDQVRIVTDSTADVPPQLARELGIAVVPCHICWEDRVYEDGIDLTPDEFYARLARARVLPRTTQPPLHSFVETYSRLLDGGCAGIVSIHIAGTLSGTLNGAWTAAQTMVEPARVRIVDSGQVSMGLGWAVIEAARLARGGASLDEVARAAEDMVPRLRAGAMIDSLDNLYKGGRVRRLTVVLGTVLDIKPLLNIQGGEVAIIARPRTRLKALDRLVAQAQAWGRPVRAGVLHTGAAALAEELADRLKREWCSAITVLGPAGAALTTHLGLGAVGMAALLAGGNGT